VTILLYRRAILLKETLTKAEWGVMNALWKKHPQPMSGVIATMGNEFNWKYNTYSTYISKLCQKGFIGFEIIGRDKFYYPLVDKDKCILAESRDIFSKLDERSKKQLVGCMLQSDELTVNDKLELKQLLEKLLKEGDSQ
jgi:BlaI family penicillinase repressor